MVLIEEVQGCQRRNSGYEEDGDDARQMKRDANENNNGNPRK